jgi:serine protease
MVTLIRRYLICAAVVVGALLPLRSSGLAAQQPDPASAPVLTRDQAADLVAAWNQGLPYVPGEVLVKFRPGSEPVQQARALSVLRRGPVPSEARWIGDVVQVHQPEESDAEVAAAMLQRQPEVLWAQPNYLRPLQAVPNDPSYSRQWNFDLIALPGAWDINPGSNARMTVAVIDSGVTTATVTIPRSLWTGRRFDMVPILFGAHPDLAQARVAAGRDFTGLSFGPALDLVGHGTHVAGTILQETNNSVGMAGIAYKATLLPLKACFGYWELQFLQAAVGVPGFVNPNEEGGCRDSDVAQAIRFAADAGAQVINLSAGGSRPSPIFLEALRYAVSKGTFVAIAAGNSFEERNPVQYPAAYAADLDGVVAVGAIGRSKRRSYFSSTGTYVELVAPGGDIRADGPVGLIYQTGMRDADFDPVTVIAPRFDRYFDQPQQGTSMAAPHVAGLAALLYSQGINNPGAIERAMKRFAQDLGPQGRDDEYGAGLIDARATLRGLGVAR